MSDFFICGFPKRERPAEFVMFATDSDLPVDDDTSAEEKGTTAALWEEIDKLYRIGVAQGIANRHSDLAVQQRQAQADVQKRRIRELLNLPVERVDGREEDV